MYMPKVGIKLTLISYLLPEIFVLASAKILFLVSLLFAAAYTVNPFDPYSLFHRSSLLTFYT